MQEDIERHGLDWFSERLASELQDYAAPEASALTVGNETLFHSVLQKAIRRADRHFALAAGLALLRCNPAALWRRLVRIAFQDYGLSDLSVTAKIVAAAADKNARLAMGGDERVLLYLLERLLGTNCDHLLDSAQRLARGNCWRLLHGEIEADDPKDELSQFIEVTCEIWTRCHDSFGSAVAPGCEAVLREFASDGSLSGCLFETCHWARRIARSALPVLLPIAKRVSEQIAFQQRVVVNTLPTTNVIGELPSYALDAHTSVGRRVLEEVLATNREVQMLVWDISPEAAKLTAIGHLLFLVDGSLCARENTDSFSRSLQRICEQYFSAIPAYRMPDAIEIMQRALPMIEFLRRSHWDQLRRKARRRSGLKQAAQG